MNIFCYGTLVERGTLEAVLGHKWEGEYEKATLGGYVRLKPSYYMVFAEEGSSVAGKLVRGLTTEDMLRLDRYESVGSGFYQRKLLTVQVGGKNVRCYVYIAGKSFHKEDYS